MFLLLFLISGLANLSLHGSSPPPPNFRGGGLKISGQNNWWGPEQKIKWGGGAKFKGGPKILGGGGYEPQLYHGCYVKRYPFMLIRF